MDNEGKYKSDKDEIFYFSQGNWYGEDSSTKLLRMLKGAVYDKNNDSSQLALIDESGRKLPLAGKLEKISEEAIIRKD